MGGSCSKSFSENCLRDIAVSVLMRRDRCNQTRVANQTLIQQLASHKHTVFPIQRAVAPLWQPAWAEHKKLRQQMRQLIKDYSDADCFQLCSYMQKMLPRELRDMIYAFYFSAPDKVYLEPLHGRILVEQEDKTKTHWTQSIRRLDENTLR